MRVRCYYRSGLEIRFLGIKLTIFRLGTDLVTPSRINLMVRNFWARSFNFDSVSLCSLFLSSAPLMP